MPSPVPHTAAVPHRGATAAATVLGAIGVASLPGVLAYTSLLLPYLLALAAPVAVAVAGQALGLRWVRDLGAVVAVVAVLAAIVGSGPALVTLVVLGPLGVVTAVGSAIRAIDPTAGTAFLSACAIAIAGGFAGAVFSPPIVVGVTVLVLAGGTAVTLMRILEHDPTPS